MIIDGGSCENVVVQEVINKLQVPTEKHPTPYCLSWFKKGNGVPISTRALISFSISGKYCDNVWCDVVPMDACDLLLGRPWQFDSSAIDHGQKNTFTFWKDNKKVILGPTKETEAA